MLAGIAAGDSGDFGGQQVENNAIFIGGPDGAIFAQKRGAGALLTTKPVTAIDQTIDKPFETDRHLG